MDGSRWTSHSTRRDMTLSGTTCLTYTGAVAERYKVREPEIVLDLPIMSAIPNLGLSECTAQRNSMCC